MSSILPYLSAIPFFVYLVYLVGRSYITTYLSQLGAPEIILSANEYIFHGTKIDTLGISFIFTLLLIGLIRYIKYEPNGKNDTKISKTSEDKRETPKWLTKVQDFNQKLPPYIVSLYFIWAAILFTYSSVSLVFNDAPYHPALLMLIMMPLAVLISFNIFYLIWGYSYIAWCKMRKRMSVVLIITLILQLALFPSVASVAWGAFRGYMDYNNLDVVNIKSDTPIIDNVEWNYNLEGNFTSSDLYLIYVNSEYLIVKSEENTINIISTKDILSIIRNETKLSSIYEQ